MTMSTVDGFYANDLEVTIDQQGEGRPTPASPWEAVGRRRWDRFPPP